MTIPGSANPLLLRSAAPTAYQVERSLRFNSSDSAYLSRTPASAGNRRTWTFSAWVKRSALGTPQAIFGARDGGSYALFFFYSGDNIGFNYGGTLPTTTEVYRDPSAWYHMVFVLDTTQATQANRLKIYVNGIQQTLSSNGLTQDQELEINVSGRNHGIGINPGDADYFNGYLADIHFIDGAALTPSDFAETNATTGQWVPKAYTGSYGTNGFKLTFSDNSNNTATTLGKDTSGNGNNFTPTNFSVTAGAGNDSLVDTPTSYGTDTGAGGEVRGNYATLNPLAKSSNVSFTNGNLDFSGSSSTGGAIATIAVSSGKWYWECVPTSNASACSIGIAKLPLDAYADNQTGTYIYLSGGNKRLSPSTDSSYGASYTDNDVIGVALDMDAGTVTFYKNNVSQGTAFSSLSGTFTAWVQDGSGSTVPTVVCNFGQRPFAYTAPSGFKALVDTNLPAPVVAKPSEVMDVKLYSGNNSTQTIPLNFNPDFIWLKCRNSARSHRLIDTVRGLNYQLWSDSTAGGNTYDATSYVSSVTSTSSSGFVVDNSGSDQYNTSGETYVAWTWDAGSSTVTNTAGSITSQVRANASAGFSIVTWTGGGSGYSVGHGLGVAPRFYIIKDRNNAFDWPVFTTVIDGSLDFLYLNLTNAKADSGGSLPTSTLVYPGQSTSSNYVMYCFAPVAGYSSFGSYTGNGSTDGPFVFTGHRSRWILIKRTDAADDWNIFDTARSTYNVMGHDLLANKSDAEYTGTYIDCLSNGFKIRETNSSRNASGGTYIYAAFAESPFAYSRAR